MLMFSVVIPADAAKRDPEQFKIWREDPAQFSFDGRYPLLEVYDKAKEAWKGACCLLLLSAHWLHDMTSCVCQSHHAAVNERFATSVLRGTYHIT